MKAGARRKPKALRAGARLAVVSPASAAREELIERGLAALRGMGYEAVVFPHALERGPIYYAGSAADRVRDLHAAFQDETIDGIVCMRGGWGSAELLPHLDAGLIRAHAKVFIGYSDHTSLHTWLENETNLVTYYAPMVASDFAREGGVDVRSWRACFEGEKLKFGVADGLRVLRKGKAEGQMRGGCLSILTESLGTPYAMRAAEGILFVEDIGSKPYQWDRMLQHLKWAGRMDGVHGIVFGDMGQCVAEAEESELLEQALLHAIGDFDGPVAIGLRCGHVNGANLTLPLGVECSLDLSDAGNPQMHFVEAAVAV